MEEITCLSWEARTTSGQQNRTWVSKCLWDQITAGGCVNIINFTRSLAAAEQRTLRIHQSLSTQEQLHFKLHSFEFCPSHRSIAGPELTPAGVGSSGGNDGARYSPNPSSRLSPATSSYWTLVSSNYTKSIICTFNHIIKRYVKEKKKQEQQPELRRRWCRWGKKRDLWTKTAMYFL